MFRKLFTISIILALFASLTIAQNRAIIRSTGEQINLKSDVDLKEAIHISGMKNFAGQTAVPRFLGQKHFTAAGTLDTLTHVKLGGTWNTNFGFFGQDVFLQFFEAPADLIIKAAGFAVTDVTGVAAGSNVSVRLIRTNWSLDQFKAFAGKNFWAGYYEAAGDGFNGVDFFGEEATGPWVDKTANGDIPLPPWADNVDPASNTFDYDLWSDGGFGWPVTPELSDDALDYQWVEMSSLGFEPEVSEGEVFCVVIIHNGVNLDADRLGFFADQTVGMPGWKYYENGRTSPGPLPTGDPGWAVRAYTWDFAVAVDLVGDRAPVISDVTSLGTTIDQGPRVVEATITDDNPGGGPAGVATAELLVAIDGGEYSAIAMSNVGGDVFSGTIPGQSPGTVVDYKVHAVDVGGKESTSGDFQYQIFEPTKPTLVIYNGSPLSRAFQLDGYYQQGLIAAGYDVWVYGDVEASLLDAYSSVIEISYEGGPGDDNREAFQTWFAGGNKNFLVMGQEILGYLYGYANKTFVAGDYEYDVLGVLNSYNDVNYGASGDEALGSIVKPIGGTALGDSLAAALDAFGTDTLLFDPRAILGATAANWMDQFDPRTDIGSEVFMHGFDVGGAEIPIGHNYTHSNGSKVAFMSYDDLNLLGTDDLWYGNSTLTPYRQALLWFGLNVVSVGNEGFAPNTFAISQNYPNPFNPTTKITYNVPSKSNVSIKVYNTLGQEVATLVNTVKNAGTHEVSFNASNLSSGVYFYTLTAGGFTSTKKMMLIK